MIQEPFADLESVKEVMAPGALDPKSRKCLRRGFGAHGCSYCITRTPRRRAKGMTEANIARCLPSSHGRRDNRLVTALACPLTTPSWSCPSSPGIVSRGSGPIHVAARKWGGG